MQRPTHREDDGWVVAAGIKTFEHDRAAGFPEALEIEVSARVLGDDGFAIEVARGFGGRHGSPNDEVLTIERKRLRAGSIVTPAGAIESRRTSCRRPRRAPLPGRSHIAPP